MTSSRIRQQFLDFFASKGHTIVDSSPVVPFDDPTLMFTNAGMNQFKDVFLGTGSRPYKRAADTQKCIRAGGKHNDLDDVGQDTYHHTFFEMLGNWSFGDYFKKEAIAWAWELLTEVWGIDKDRLHATYFEGDEAEKLEPDSEAAELWRTVTDIDPTHIHPGNKKDNFWEMGDTGPCGPCSEIHIDLTPDKSGASLVNAGDARVIELWNLVFIQFAASWLPGGEQRINEWDRTSSAERSSKFSERSRSELLAKSRKLDPLPEKHVDTGMGFERICAVLDGTERGNFDQVSNYDTDVFTPILDAQRKRTAAAKCTGLLPGRADARSDDHAQQMIDVSYRVIADHIRCLTFALTDGAIPGNEGRGYVLRRILRRAVRYGRQYLDMHEPFLCDLVEPLVKHMAGAFPELRSAHGGKNVEHVAELIRDEEASFLRTLDQGITTWLKFAGEALWEQILDENEDKYANSPEEALYMSVSHSKDVELFEEDPELVHPNAWITMRRGLNQVLERFQLRNLTKQRVLKYCEEPPTMKSIAAFKLFDTYGFPVDLTQLMAQEYGMRVDLSEYDQLIEQSRGRARAVIANVESHADLKFEAVTPIATIVDDSRKYLDVPKCSAFITSVAKHTKLFAKDSSSVGDSVVFLTNRTCFYAEQGGQIGDVGYVSTDKGRVRLTPVQRRGDRIIHSGKVISGEFTFGPCEMEVDLAHRRPTTQNHTSTHLLNWALREVLCEPGERENPRVQQRGSLVDPDKTRFDFSHRKPLTEEQLERIESLVNERIEADLPVYTEEVDQQEALKIKTLRAVFGEKYPDRVRVVSIGAPIGQEGGSDTDTLLGSPKDEKWFDYSVEFCGGTHLKKTGEAEHFVLTAEEGVAKGIRRVVGVSGQAALDAEKVAQTFLEEASRNLEPARTHDSPADASDSAQTSNDFAAALADFQRRVSEATIPLQVRIVLRECIAEMQQVAKERRKVVAADVGAAVRDCVASLLAGAETVGGVTIVVGEVPSAGADALRGGIDWVRNKTEASAVLLASASEGKVVLIAGMSKAVVAKGVRAGDLIKEIAPLVGGRGGGRPDMAQGGGGDSSGLPKAVERAGAWIADKLG